MDWRDRAQRNSYGVCPLVVITKGWIYDINYRLGADVDMDLLQHWLYRQVGKTIRTVPVHIDSLKTAEEHAAGNIYFDIAAGLIQLKSHPIPAAHVAGSALRNSGGKQRLTTSWDNGPH